MEKDSVQYALDVLKPVIEKLGIEVFVVEGGNGQWLGPNQIEIGKDADAYSVAHEIGHVICGFSCCEEHCEFEAHGAAKVLCTLYDLPLNENEHEPYIVYNAARSEHEACTRAAKNYKRCVKWLVDRTLENYERVDSVLRKAGIEVSFIEDYIRQLVRNDYKELRDNNG